MTQHKKFTIKTQKFSISFHDDGQIGQNELDVLTAILSLPNVSKMISDKMLGSHVSELMFVVDDDMDAIRK